MKNYVLFILLIGITFSSCKKAWNEWMPTRVSGIVVDSNGNPVEEIQVVISGNASWDEYPYHDSFTTIYATTSTDHNGEFKFPVFHAEGEEFVKYYVYALGCTGDNYDLKKGKKNTYRFIKR